MKAKLDAAGYTTTLQSFTTSAGTSYNVIAEWPHGDANHVVMAGSHLDSVSSGPGSTTTAQVAPAYSKPPSPTLPAARPQEPVEVRLLGAEELGLLGSKYYVNNLPAAERDKIELYLNFDMIASPNPGYFVYDDNPAGNGARDDLVRTSPARACRPSSSTSRAGPTTPRSGRSGSRPRARSPVAEGTKTSAQAAKWGTAGQAFDPCYHRSCDNINNLNLTSLDRQIDAIGHMVWNYTQKDYSEDPPPTGDNLLQNPGFESVR